MNKLVQAGAVPSQAGAPGTDVLAQERAARFELRAALCGVPRIREQPSRADAALFRSILDACPDACPDAWPAGEGAGRAGGGNDGDGRDSRHSGRATDDSAGMDGGRIHPARQSDRDSDAARTGLHADAEGVPRLQAVADIVVRVCVQSQECGGRAVRFTLDNAVLPGTQLSVYEHEGRLAVDFVSMHAGTRLRLCHSAGPIARRVAADLSRDVLLRVAASDRQERAIVEVMADAPLAAGRTDDRGGIL
jgi:hypothetical protein